MILQEIIQMAQSVPVSDITFGVWDVVKIVGGVGGLLSVYFLLKYRIDSYNTKLETHMDQYEKGNNLVHIRIDDVEKDNTELRKELGNKHDDLKNYMQQMEIRIIREISKNK